MINAYWLTKIPLLIVLSLSVDMKGIPLSGHINEIDHLTAVGLSYCSTLCERCYP